MNRSKQQSVFQSYPTETSTPITLMVIGFFASVAAIGFLLGYFGN